MLAHLNRRVVIPVSCSDLPKPADLPGGPVDPPHGPTLRPPHASVAGREPASVAEPILCEHCGRTASNGISCIGACVADSGY